jgi:ABC-type lipoprotein release transport system permease subunit
VAAFSALVATNVMLTLQTLSLAGQAAVLALTFSLVCIITAALVVDILSRSSQTVATLRTLGANQRVVALSILVSLIAFGAAGSAAGALLGGGLGAALGALGAAPAQGAAATLTAGLVVWVLSIGAVAAGVLLGVRAAWRR